MISTKLIVLGLAITGFGVVSVMIAALVVTALWSAQTVKEFIRDDEDDDE